MGQKIDLPGDSLEMRQDKCRLVLSGTIFAVLSKTKPVFVPNCATLSYLGTKQFVGKMLAKPVARYPITYGGLIFEQSSQQWWM